MFSFPIAFSAFSALWGEGIGEECEECRECKGVGIYVICSVFRRFRSRVS